MKMALVLIALLFNLSIGMQDIVSINDTIITSDTEYKVNTYTENGYDSVLIHVSTTYYKNGSKVGYSLFWGDTLNILMIDSLTSYVSNDRVDIRTWREGEIYTQYTVFNSIIEIDISLDTRTVVYVNDKNDANIIHFNSYEIRVFSNRIVELYYMDDHKVYSVFTLIETDSPDTTPQPESQISDSDVIDA